MGIKRLWWICVLVIIVHIFLVTSVSVANALPDNKTWRVLLIVFKQSDFDYLDQSGNKRHLSTTIEDGNINLAAKSIAEKSPQAVREWSNNYVDWNVDVVISPRLLTHISGNDPSWQYVTPTDVSDLLNQFAPIGSYDSVFVYWKDTDGANKVPGGWWGLASSYWRSAPWTGFINVRWAPDSMWTGSGMDEPNQVWIHEWLHTVSNWYQGLGYTLPQRDADGAELHGYSRNQDGLPGWGKYYTDLMRGTVLENGAYTGITPSAWLSGAPRKRFTYGKIAGQVVDNRGKVISNARITVEGIPITFDLRDGHFIAGLIPVGFHAVNYEAPGYLSQTQLVEIRPEQVAQAPTCLLSPTASVVGTSVGSGEIFGQVVNRGKRRIPGTVVRVNNIVMPTGYRGRFKFTLVAPGIYTIYYDAPGHKGQTQMVDVRASQVTRSPMVVLSR